jgi:hypothetical protein
MQMPRWCGACDPDTRRFDLGDSERRCPHCHPYWSFGHSSVDPGQVPVTPTERTRAIRWLAYELSRLRVLPESELSRRIQPFFESGWTPQDVVHALDFDPDGSRVRSAPASDDPPDLTRRTVLNLLASWCDEHGAPLPSASQRAAERRRRLRQRQLAARAEWADLAARRTNPDGATTSGAREIARQAAARAKQIRLEGRHRESSHLLAELAEQEAQEAKVRQSLRQLGKWRFGIVPSGAGASNPSPATPAAPTDPATTADSASPATNDPEKPGDHRSAA